MFNPFKSEASKYTHKFHMLTVGEHLNVPAIEYPVFQYIALTPITWSSHLSSHLCQACIEERMKNVFLQNKKWVSKCNCVPR